jgi:hypothetical protein
MNRMNALPGFTAEASVYQSERRYAALATGAAGVAASASVVVPQFPTGLCTKAAYYCNRGYQKWCDIEDRVCNFDI